MVTFVRAKLTERVVRDAKLRERAFVIWDQDLKGFGCKVFPSGKKSYVLSYTSEGRKRLSTVARCNELSLEEARDRARTEFVQIRGGAPGPLERRREEREAPTVNHLLERFFSETVPDRIAAGRFTERTAREYRWHARRYVAPALGKMRIGKVTRHDVEQLAATLSDRPSQRNRVLAFVSRVFGLAERWEWRSQHTNPARGIERGREEPRRRILSRDDLASLSKALNNAEVDHPQSVAAIRVAGLTGLRISEVLAMRWSDIDFEAARALRPAPARRHRAVRDVPPGAARQGGRERDRRRRLAGGSAGPGRGRARCEGAWIGRWVVAVRTCGSRVRRRSLR